MVDFIVSGDFLFHAEVYFFEERRDLMYYAAKCAGIGWPCAFDTGGHVTVAIKLV